MRSAAIGGVDDPRAIPLGLNGCARRGAEIGVARRGGGRCVARDGAVGVERERERAEGGAIVVRAPCSSPRGSGWARRAPGRSPRRRRGASFSPRATRGRRRGLRRRPRRRTRAPARRRERSSRAPSLSVRGRRAVVVREWRGAARVFKPIPGGGQTCARLARARDERADAQPRARAFWRDV